jgi:hypothetical protein
MRISWTAMAVAAAVLVTAPAGPVLGGPIPPFPIATGEQGSLLKVYHRRGHRPHCHRDIRRHYHNVFQRRAWHRHVGPRCRPVLLRRFDYPRFYPGCVRIGPFWFCPW